MKITYSISQRCMAYVLLASLFLQSCTNFSHPTITPGKKSEDEDPRESKLELDKQIPIEEKVDTKLAAQGSDITTIQHQGGQLQVDVKENLLESFNKAYLQEDYAQSYEELSQRSSVEKATDRPTQPMEEADKLANYDYTKLQIPIRSQEGDNLPIGQQPINTVGSPGITYNIDGENFKRQNVSGKAMRCFFNVTGLDVKGQIKKLREHQNDPVVRYMIANEIVSAIENPGQLPLTVKKAINYELYQFQRESINELEEKRSDMLREQNPIGNEQDTLAIPKVFQSTSKRYEAIREDLRQRACTLNAFNTFVNDHIDGENMMVALHDVQGDGKGDNLYANYTSIDAIAYINRLGIKIYQPITISGKLRLAHQFIPANATQVAYLYHSNFHFQALIPTERKDNEQPIPLKGHRKSQEVRALDLQAPKIEETDFAELPKKPSVAPPEGIEILEHKTGKKYLKAIDFKEDLVQGIASHLANFEPWEDIPNFVVITGENGSGKTQLLRYIHHMILKSKNSIPEINVLLRGPDYTNSEINSNSYNKINPRFFLEEEGRLKLMEELKKYCEWKECNETGAISSRLENTLENEPIYKHIKDKIDRRLVPKSTDPDWQEEIKYRIESYKDYCPKDPNVNEPVLILAQAFSIHEQGNKQLLERYKQRGYAEELFSTYLEKEKKEIGFDTLNAFGVKIQDPAYKAELINFYLREKLKRIPLWEEINSILEAYGFTYRVDFVDGGNSNKKLVLKRNTAKDIITIKPEDLSSGERLMLDLMSWLFYFRGFSLDGTDPAQIKDIDIMLLDEPDRHLDPKLCEILHKVLYHEFVQKRHIQVIMTTHRLDTVISSPENVYTIGEAGLNHNVKSAVNRMTTHIIERAINHRSAASALSGGRLTVIKDVNYVLVENEDDVKFFNIVYKKFLAALSCLSKMTELIFMPVGVSLKDITETVKELRSSFDKIGEILRGVQIQDKDELGNLLSASKDLIKTLSEGVDRSGGSSQVKKRVNEIPLYEGKYDEQGKMVEGGRLKKLEKMKHHSQVIWGMIDNDRATRGGASNAEGNVHAIDEVYSFENYLCMPLNLFYFMKEYEKKQQNKPEINIEEHPFANTLLYWAVLNGISLSHPLEYLFENFKKEEASQEDLQKISDQVIEYLRERYKKQEKGSFFTETDLSPENRVELSLINGYKIRCPKLFFTTRGHDLLREISAIILDKRDESKMQKLLFDTLERMPVDFLPGRLLTSIKRLQRSEEVSKELIKEGENNKKVKKADNSNTLKAIISYLDKSKKLKEIQASQNSQGEIKLFLPGTKKQDIIAFCVQQLKMQSEDIEFGRSNQVTLYLSTQEQVLLFQKEINNWLFANKLPEQSERHKKSVSKPKDEIETGTSAPKANIIWDSLTIAEHLWKNPKTAGSIDELIVNKVNLASTYLEQRGYQLEGVKSDGNCFLSAFLGSYNTLSTKITTLDEAPNKISYLRSEAARFYSSLYQDEQDRAKEIREDTRWIHSDEGGLLAKSLGIPIRLLTVNKDQDGEGVSDILIFAETGKANQPWDETSVDEKPQEYIFIVDVGHHFLWAKRKNSKNSFATSNRTESVRLEESFPPSSSTTTTRRRNQTQGEHRSETNPNTQKHASKDLKSSSYSSSKSTADDVRPSEWNESTMATYLWEDKDTDPPRHFSKATINGVKLVSNYLEERGYQLEGAKADGNCFFYAFLSSYDALSPIRIPLLDMEQNKASYLRSVVASFFRDSREARSKQIEQNGELVTGTEGEKLAKHFRFPIRMVTVNKNQSHITINDILTFPEPNKDSQEWDTLSNNEKPQEFIFIVDVGGHFLWARKMNENK